MLHKFNIKSCIGILKSKRKIKIQNKLLINAIYYIKYVINYYLYYKSYSF